MDDYNEDFDKPVKIFVNNFWLNAKNIESK
jgi:hypothetical protein